MHPQILRYGVPPISRSDAFQPRMLQWGQEKFRIYYREKIAAVGHLWHQALRAAPHNCWSTQPPLFSQVSQLQRLLPLPEGKSPPPALLPAKLHSSSTTGRILLVLSHFGEGGVLTLLVSPCPEPINLAWTAQWVSGGRGLIRHFLSLCWSGLKLLEGHTF